MLYMVKLNSSPTKSNLLKAKKQRAIAVEGYDLLDQKRQILIFELMNRMVRVRNAKKKVADSMKIAFTLLRNAELELGAVALERLTIGVQVDYQFDVKSQRLMGLRIPSTLLKIGDKKIPFGLSSVSLNTDQAMNYFIEALPGILELAELETAVLRIAHELRKTGRRCNALSKIFIPRFEETIRQITAILEERERESFTTLKMLRERLDTKN